MKTTTNKGRRVADRIIPPRDQKLLANVLAQVIEHAIVDRADERGRLLQMPARRRPVHPQVAYAVKGTAAQAKKLSPRARQLWDLLRAKGAMPAPAIERTLHLGANSVKGMLARLRAAKMVAVKPVVEVEVRHARAS